MATLARQLQQGWLATEEQGWLEPEPEPTGAVVAHASLEREAKNRRTVHVGGLHDRMRDDGHHRSSSSISTVMLSSERHRMPMARDDGDHAAQQLAHGWGSGSLTAPGHGQRPVSLENEPALRALFGRFGKVEAVTVRRRRSVEGGRRKVSWALVSFDSEEEAYACVAGSRALGFEKDGLVVRRLDVARALESTGAMGRIALEHYSRTGEHATQMFGTYRVLKTCTVRRGKSAEDTKVGEYAKNTVIDLVEESSNSLNLLVGRSSTETTDTGAPGGWVKLRTARGQMVLEKLAGLSTGRRMTVKIEHGEAVPEELLDVTWSHGLLPPIAAGSSHGRGSLLGRGASSPSPTVGSLTSAALGIMLEEQDGGGDGDGPVIAVTGIRENDIANNLKDITVGLTLRAIDSHSVAGKSYESVIGLIDQALAGIQRKTKEEMCLTFVSPDSAADLERRKLSKIMGRLGHKVRWITLRERFKAWRGFLDDKRHYSYLVDQAFVARRRARLRRAFVGWCRLSRQMQHGLRQHRQLQSKMASYRDRQVGQFLRRRQRQRRHEGGVMVKVLVAWQYWTADTRHARQDAARVEAAGYVSTAEECLVREEPDYESAILNYERALSLAGEMNDTAGDLTARYESGLGHARKALDEAAESSRIRSLVLKRLMDGDDAASSGEYPKAVASFEWGLGLATSAAGKNTCDDLRQQLQESLMNAVASQKVAVARKQLQAAHDAQAEDAALLLAVERAAFEQKRREMGESRMASEKVLRETARAEKDQYLKTIAHLKDAANGPIEQAKATQLKVHEEQVADLKRDSQQQIQELMDRQQRLLTNMQQQQQEQQQVQSAAHVKALGTVTAQAARAAAKVTELQFKMQSEMQLSEANLRQEAEDARGALQDSYAAQLEGSARALAAERRGREKEMRLKDDARADAEKLLKDSARTEAEALMETIARLRADAAAAEARATELQSEIHSTSVATAGPIEAAKAAQQRVHSQEIAELKREYQLQIEELMERQQKLLAETQQQSVQLQLSQSSAHAQSMGSMQVRAAQAAADVSAIQAKMQAETQLSHAGQTEEMQRMLTTERQAREKERMDLDEARHKSELALKESAATEIEVLLQTITSMRSEAEELVAKAKAAAQRVSEQQMEAQKQQYELQIQELTQQQQQLVGDLRREAKNARRRLIATHEHQAEEAARALAAEREPRERERREMTDARTAAEGALKQSHATEIEALEAVIARLRAEAATAAAQFNTELTAQAAKIALQAQQMESQKVDYQHQMDLKMGEQNALRLEMQRQHTEQLTKQQEQLTDRQEQHAALLASQREAFEAERRELLLTVSLPQAEVARLQDQLNTQLQAQADKHSLDVTELQSTHQAHITQIQAGHADELAQAGSLRAAESDDATAATVQALQLQADETTRLLAAERDGRGRDREALTGEREAHEREREALTDEIRSLMETIARLQREATAGCLVCGARGHADRVKRADEEADDLAERLVRVQHEIRRRGKDATTTTARRLVDYHHGAKRHVYNPSQCPSCAAQRDVATSSAKVQKIKKRKDPTAPEVKVAEVELAEKNAELLHVMVKQGEQLLGVLDGKEELNELERTAVKGKRPTADTQALKEQRKAIKQQEARLLKQNGLDESERRKLRDGKPEGEHRPTLMGLPGGQPRGTATPPSTFAEGRGHSSSSPIG